MAANSRDIAIERARGYAWERIAASFGLESEAARGRFRRWRRKNEEEWENLKNQYDTPAPIIGGLFPADFDLDPGALWEQAFKAQDQAKELTRRRRTQSVEIPDWRPVGIAFLSDAHFGSASTDYRQARDDADIIGATPGLYAAEHGDGTDNWIVGRLQAQQRGQVVSFAGEQALYFDWLARMEGRLLWWIAGNHPWWTYKLAGVQPFRDRLRGVPMLYDPHEVYLTLRVGQAEWRILARHKWKYGSIFNATHGIEVAWERRGLDFDIGIGGHTHTGTLCREFLRHGRKRYAIQIGTYKTDGDYGRELGLPEPYGRGCGMMIFYPDGGLQWFEDLARGAEFLTYLRNSSHNENG